MKLVNIGFGNFVNASRILSVLSPDSAPIKRIMSEAKDTGRLIDASFGRKTRGVIVTDTDHTILCALAPEVLAARVSGENENSSGGEH